MCSRLEDLLFDHSEESVVGRERSLFEDFEAHLIKVVHSFAAFTLPLAQAGTFFLSRSAAAVKTNQVPTSQGHRHALFTATSNGKPLEGWI